MNSQIVLFSDLHVNDANVHIIEARMKSLAGIIGAQQSRLENLVVLCAGDIAQSGKKAEYEYFEIIWSSFVDLIRSKYKNIRIDFCAVPGNHDVDISGEEDGLFSDLLEKDLREKGRLDDLYSVHSKHFKKRQSAFYDSMCKISGEEIKPELYAEKIISLFNSRFAIKLNLYNSSCVFSSSQERGRYSFPNTFTYSQKDEDSLSLVLSLIHHPLDYFNIECRRRMQEYIESKSHFLVSGHDHSYKSGMYRTSGVDVNTIEMPALYSTDREGGSICSLYVEWPESGENVKVRQYFYQLDADGYFVCTDKNDFSLLLKRTSSVPQFKESFYHKISELKLPFEIEGKTVLNHDDYYIYPNLRIHGKNSTVCLSADSLLFEGEGGKYLAITGPYSCGKTTLAKLCMKRYHRKGKLPVYLDCSQVSGKDVSSILNKYAEEQYEFNQGRVYLQHDRSKIVVILDNLHLLRLTRYTQREFVEEVCSIAPNVIVFANEQLYLYQDVESNIYSMLPSTFECYDMMEFNHYLRLKYIEKWVQNIYTDKDEEKKSIQIADWESSINRLLGRSIVPKFPFFITLVIQAMTLSQDSIQQAKVGTHGGLYDLVMQLQLSRICDADHSIDTYRSYLSGISYSMFTDSRSNISEKDFSKYHEEYTANIGVRLSKKKMISELERIGIIEVERYDETPISYRFRHNYCYYYFVAYYISNNLDNKDCESMVDELMCSIHETECSNVLVFLAHLSRKKYIIERLIEHIGKHLSEIEEINFDVDFNDFAKYSRAAFKLSFDDKGYSKLAEDRARAADSIESNRAESLQQSKDSPPSRLFAAMKLIEVSGQLMRNFVGSISLNDKVELLKGSYSLSLRSIKYFTVVMGKIIEALSASIKRECGESATKADIENAYNELMEHVSSLMQFFAFATMRKVADSVSHRQLEQAYTRTFDAIGDSSTSKMLDMIVRLCALNDYSSLLELAQNKKMNANVFMSKFVQLAAFSYCYMTPLPSPIKQKICEQTGINYRAVNILERKSK